MNLGWVGQHVVTGQVQCYTWFGPSCAAELGAANRVSPKTLLLPKSLQLVRHKPAGGLLSATDHGWRQVACCHCHTKRCLRLQLSLH